MIVSRTAELARLDALLAALVRGDGGALVVHGEAGIGKTTMLEALVERCGDVVTVVRACGAETEAELAFSALADLLGPVLCQLDVLPVQQAAALTGALALGPPEPGDRLAVCVAALGVLRAEARRGPVLAVVDDVQWIDASSRECIEYVARRAGGSLAVVLAARDPLYPPERLRLQDLPLGPIDDTAAAELLRHRAPGLAPPVAAAVAQAAAGNPLALVELPATLTARQRAGVAELEFPLVPGGRLQRAFACRVDALGEPGQAGAAGRRRARRGRAACDRGRVPAGWHDGPAPGRRGGGRPGATRRGPGDLRTPADPRPGLPGGAGSRPPRCARRFGRGAAGRR